MESTAYHPVSDSTFFRPPATEDLDRIHAMEAGSCSWCIFRACTTCDSFGSLKLDKNPSDNYGKPLHPVHGHQLLGYMPARA